MLLPLDRSDADVLETALSVRPYEDRIEQYPAVANPDTKYTRGSSMMKA